MNMFSVALSIARDLPFRCASRRPIKAGFRGLEGDWPMAEIVSLKRTEPSGPVNVRREGPALLVTLTNPPANPLSLAVIAALSDGLEQGRDDREVRAIVIGAMG